MSERLSYWETTSKGRPPSKTADEFWKEYDAKETSRKQSTRGGTISSPQNFGDRNNGRENSLRDFGRARRLAEWRANSLHKPKKVKTGRKIT